MFDWLTRKKLSSKAELLPSGSEGIFTCDENAVPDTNCKACKQGWPVHVDGKGSRMHIDIIGFHKDYGMSQPCPTQEWPDEEEETQNVFK